MFSVVMENSIADNYYTEKIIDCFITGNIPIYRGCKNIGKFFDKRGIIEFNNIEDLRHILDSLTPQIYEEMLPYVKINFELALNVYLKILEIEQSIYSEDSFELAKTYDKIANLYMQLGN